MRSHIAIAVAFFFAAAGAFAQSAEREAFLDAESRFLSKDYSLAAERYDEFVRTWPDSAYAADARYRRAVALYRLGRLDESYRAFELVEARYRGTKYLSYVPFWKAVIDYDRGALEKAAALFSEVLAAPPDREAERQALLYAGKALTALGKKAEATSDFEKLLTVLDRPEDEASGLLFLSGLYAEAGNWGSLISLWERLDPARLDEETRERISLYAAEAYSQSGRAVDAVALYEKLASSSRRDVAIAALQRLFVEARRSGDEERLSSVVIRAENALRGDSEVLSEFWLRVGAGSFDDGRYDLARSYFLRIAALLPAEKLPPDVPIYLAAIAYREGRTAAAYDELSGVAAAAGSRRALSYLWLGRYALELGRWDAAVDALRSALDAARSGDASGFQDSADAESLSGRYLAYALMKKGAAEEALAVVDATGAAALAGGLRFRADVLARSGRAADAAELLGELTKEQPRDPEPRVALMILLYGKGQYRQVLSELEAYDAAIAAPSGGEGAGSASGASSALGFYAASRYLAGVSAAALGSWQSALGYLDQIPVAARPGLGEATPWADYYRSWAAYRLSRFQEARAGFDSFRAANPKHPAAYQAAYLSAWCSASLGDYAAGVKTAVEAAAMAATPAAVSGTPSAEARDRLAKARYLEGVLRSFLSDWDGALKAFDASVAAGSRAYSVRASFERGVVFDLAGKSDAADEAFAATARNYPGESLAEEASFRRGDTLYRAGRYAAAADRYAAYRTAFPSGTKVDAALYMNGLASAAAGKTDAAILLWERLLADFPSSRYRFPALFQAGRAYREKGDLESAFRCYTSALAEFGDTARKAGAADEAEVLRYRMTGLPEKAARLHVAIKNADGAATLEGRRAQIALGRFYIDESGQREAGLPLLDEVIALRSEDGVSAAEASALKGEYYSLAGSYDKAAAAYLDAVSWASGAQRGAATSTGASVFDDFIPEELYNAAFAKKRGGKDAEAADLAAALAKNYPSSTWAAQARRLTGGSR